MRSKVLLPISSYSRYFTFLSSNKVGVRGSISPVVSGENNATEQWFWTWADLAPRRHLAVWECFWLSQLPVAGGATDIQGGGARDSAKHPRRHRTALHNKDQLAPNASSAKAENLCCKRSQLIFPITFSFSFYVAVLGPFSPSPPKQTCLPSELLILLFLPPLPPHLFSFSLSIFCSVIIQCFMIFRSFQSLENIHEIVFPAGSQLTMYALGLVMSLLGASASCL